LIAAPIVPLTFRVLVMPLVSLGLHTSHGAGGGRQPLQIPRLSIICDPSQSNAPPSRDKRDRGIQIISKFFISPTFHQSVFNRSLTDGISFQLSPQPASRTKFLFLQGCASLISPPASSGAFLHPDYNLAHGALTIASS
jgi:hypothetical protein